MAYLKVSVNSYFDPFITNCAWYINKDLSWPNFKLMMSKRGSKDKEASGFCNVEKLTEKWITLLKLYGYRFWSYYHCWYIMYKFKSFLIQFCINDVINRRQGFKNFKISFINIFLSLMFHYIYDLSSLIELDIQLWASFKPILEFRQSKRLGMDHNITILKNCPQKWITNLDWKKYNYHIWNIVYKFGSN